jgi:hypothetical protein
MLVMAADLENISARASPLEVVVVGAAEVVVVTVLVVGAADVVVVDAEVVGAAVVVVGAAEVVALVVVAATEVVGVALVVVVVLSPPPPHPANSTAARTIVNAIPNIFFIFPLHSNVLFPIWNR